MGPVGVARAGAGQEERRGRAGLMQRKEPGLGPGLWGVGPGPGGGGWVGGGGAICWGWGQASLGWGHMPMGRGQTWGKEGEGQSYIVGGGVRAAYPKGGAIYPRG